MYALGKERTLDQICPLCSEKAAMGQSANGDGYTYICPTCGMFRLTEKAQFILGARTQPEFYKLSYFFRSSSQHARKPIELPMWTAEEVEKLLLSTHDLSVQAKLDLLLIHLGNISGYPGDSVIFDHDNDYSLFCARNRHEAMFYFDVLLNQGLITAIGYTFTVTASGWNAIEERKNTGGSSNIAFIAMWFDKARDPMDLAISDAITLAGYTPLRIDRHEHVNRIDDEIISQIRSSKFLVADLTGQRNGVYFEAGFMLGLGRPVIWVCDHSELEKVHFDTRQFNTIAYVSKEDLRRRLQFRIEALLGKGAN